MKKYLLLVGCCVLLIGCSEPKNEDNSLGFDVISSQCKPIDEDMSCYEEILSVARNEGRKKDEADILASIGYHYKEAGDKERATEAFQKSLEIHKTENFMKDSEWGSIFHADSINGNLGDMYFPLKKAIPYYNEVLEIERKEEVYEMYKSTLGNILLIYDAENSTFQEIQTYLQELEDKNETFQKGLAFRMAGRIYGERGNADYALSFYKQALPFLNGENLLFTDVLKDLSVLEFNNENCKEALSYISQARDIFNKLEEYGVNAEYDFDQKKFQINFSGIEATCSLQVKDYDRALLVYKKNLEVYQDSPDLFGGDPSEFIVMGYLLKGDMVNSEKYIVNRKKTLQTIFDNGKEEILLINALKVFDAPNEQIDIYAELAEFSEKNGQKEKTKKYYEQALAVAKKAENTRATEELQQRISNLSE